MPKVFHLTQEFNVRVNLMLMLAMTNGQSNMQKKLRQNHSKKVQKRLQYQMISKHFFQNSNILEEQLKHRLIILSHN